MFTPYYSDIIKILWKLQLSWFKGTLTRDILAFFYIIFNVIIFIFPSYFKIYILNFYPLLAKRFIICSSFTEHARKSLAWTEQMQSLNTFGLFYACSLHTRGDSNLISHSQAFSENMCEIAWAYSRASSVKQLQIMKHFARWRLKFRI